MTLVSEATHVTHPEIILEECPVCKGILTSWAESQIGQWVCDGCGFGKSSQNEYKTLQKIIKYRIKWFKYSWMKNDEANYLQRSILTQ